MNSLRTRIVQKQQELLAIWSGECVQVDGRDEGGDGGGELPARFVGGQRGVGCFGAEEDGDGTQGVLGQ